MDSFFETTWGAQATPASHPSEGAHPLPPLMLPLSMPSAPLQQHLLRQNSHAEAHALAAHAAMGSYTLAAAQNGMPALPQLHTKSALHSRRNSSDGGASALLLPHGAESEPPVTQRRMQHMCSDPKPNHSCCSITAQTRASMLRDM